MNNFRYRLFQFMQGRRGIDQLGRFTMNLAVVLLLLSMFTGRIPALYMLTYFGGTILFFLGFYRALSRNLYKREIENNKFLALRYKYTGGKTLKQMMQERKYYAVFKCPGCGQKMRAPKGKGTIKVRCHGCGTEFNKKV